MSDWVGNRSVYLHIPKTGGNWIRSVIKDSQVHTKKTNKYSKHATYDFLMGSGLSRRPSLVAKTKASQINFFCVVRHPLLWYQSWYRYQKDCGWKQWGVSGDTSAKMWHCLSALNMPEPSEFNEFIERVNIQAPGFLTYLYHSYVLPSGARVLKNESLRVDLLALNEEWNLGLNQKIISNRASENLSTKIPIRWSEKNFSETLKYEGAALDFYGYSGPHNELINIE